MVSFDACSNACNTKKLLLDDNSVPMLGHAPVVDCIVRINQKYQRSYIKCPKSTHLLLQDLMSY